MNRYQAPLEDLVQQVDRVRALLSFVTCAAAQELPDLHSCFHLRLSLELENRRAFAQNNTYFGQLVQPQLQRLVNQVLKIVWLVFYKWQLASSHIYILLFIKSKAVDFWEFGRFKINISDLLIAKFIMLNAIIKIFNSIKS